MYNTVDHTAVTRTKNEKNEARNQSSVVASVMKTRENKLARYVPPEEKRNNPENDKKSYNVHGRITDKPAVGQCVSDCSGRFVG